MIQFEGMYSFKIVHGKNVHSAIRNDTGGTIMLRYCPATVLIILLLILRCFKAEKQIHFFVTQQISQCGCQLEMIYENDQQLH